MRPSHSTDSNKVRANLFRRYLKQHVILASAIVLLCTYYGLREVRAVADFATRYIAHPWHRFAGQVFDVFPCSVAEWLCAVAVITTLAFILFAIYKIVREPGRLRRVYGTLVTVLAGALLAYSFLCWLWGISFYSYTYTELSGIEAEPLSVEELRDVTVYFAAAANSASEAVDRDENGLYFCDIQAILYKSPALYANLPEEFGFLEGPEVHPKPMVFSYLMSHMNFTGMFFPFTGEANINVHAPDCYIPSTVAHELAHQRGVAREQDANFTAVLVCMESNDENFTYSGALLAYTHLGNSLRQASYEDWEEVYSLLGEDVRRDLAANNEYWAEFQTPAAEISETAYSSFLQNQGQELGMRSYGACVDLLVAYYGEAAGRFSGKAG